MKVEGPRTRVLLHSVSPERHILSFTVALEAEETARIILAACLSRRVVVVTQSLAATVTMLELEFDLSSQVIPCGDLT